MTEDGAVRPNPGDARWCEQHGRFECTKKAGTCHGSAIRGTDACKYHGGQSLEVLRAKGEARIAAITAFSALGGAVPSVEPGFAVLASLHMSWLRVHLYARLLEEQVEADAAYGPGGLSSAVGVTSGGVEQQTSPDGAGGLIGHAYAADKMAGIFASGEAVRALVTLEAQERDRAVRFAKVAHDMGIAEREVRLAERQGELLATVIRGVLDDLDLTDEQQGKAPAAIQSRLRAVAELEATGGAA